MLPSVTTSHTTKTIRVQYTAPVLASTRRLIVLPPEQRGSQRIVNAHWHCTPQPALQHESTDDFGNRVLELRHQRIQREFVFTLTLTTARNDINAPREMNVPPIGVGAFRLASARCDLGGAIHAAAKDFTNTGDAPARLADALCAWTHERLQYRPGLTQVETTASQALERGGGVCQDYAHVMIALCRARGLAARYVSGFNPAEGMMHAWVEVLCGDAWIAFDPTHNRRTRPDCVYIACGRDYRDVTPVAGSFRGRAQSRMRVFCRTQTIGDE